MKILDKIADKIIEIPFIDKAHARNEARIKVNEVSFTLIYHIVKVIIMPESNQIDMWVNKIDRILLDMPMRISWYGSITYEQYWQWLMEDPEHSMDEIIKWAKDDYPDEEIILPNNLKEEVNSVVHRMCVDLVKDEEDVDLAKELERTAKEFFNEH